MALQSLQTPAFSLIKILIYFNYTWFSPAGARFRKVAIEAVLNFTVFSEMPCGGTAVLSPPAFLHITNVIYFNLPG
jgi:hypothetical protein